MRLLFGLLMLSACASIEADMLASQGWLRVEPHPEGRGVMRAHIAMTPPSTTAFRFAETATEAGRRNALASYLGPRCNGLTMAEEGRVQLSPILGEPREQITYRVTC